MSGIVRLILLVAVLGLWSPRARAADLVVGGKDFTEQKIVAEITAQLLERKGIPVKRRVGLTTAAIRAAQEDGEVSLYWEYTGTSLTTFNGISARLDPREAYRRVRELDGRRGLVWLDPSDVDDTYAFATRAEVAEAHGLRTLSDLAARVTSGRRLKFGINAEFLGRADGLKPLEQAYGFTLERSEIVRLDQWLVYNALRDGVVDVGLVFSTDGRIAADRLRLLVDDRGFFPSYVMVPVVRKDVLDARPELARHLNAIAAKLGSAGMARLNAAVDVQRRAVEDVATEFLVASDLL